MRPFWAIFPALFLLLVLPSYESFADRADIIRTGSTEVMANVFDDQISTVYIRVNDSLINAWVKPDKVVADIMTKKRDWENKFPDKRIVALSFATAGIIRGGGVVPVIVGLLIHYEKRWER